ncbi:MAG: TlpA disulfide reductase family protein [bacterium]
MRFIPAILLFVFLYTGCVPDAVTDINTNDPDTVLQYKNNISALYGKGSKIAKDNTGAYLVSNIIWKDSLGVTQSLDSLRGKKVLLNFWAIWCVPCESEMKDLQAVADTKDVTVIGICTLDFKSSLFDRAKLYAESRQLKFQMVTDPNSYLYANYGGTGTEVPWSFAIDRSGHIAQKLIGAQTKDVFLSVFNRIP